MTCYRLIAHHTGEELSPRRKVSFREPRLRLPKRYCPECRVRPRADCADVPEELPRPAAKLLARYRCKCPESLLLEMMDAIDRSDDNRASELDNEMEEHGGLSPAEYDEVTATFREMLGLDESRVLVPERFAGPWVARVRRPLTTDMIVGVGYVPIAVMTDLAAEWLRDSGLTGFRVFPIPTKVAAEELGEYRLHTMVVTGDGGLPVCNSRNAEYRLCSTCGTWALHGELPVRLSLGEQQWDGSDFFHLAGQGPVYVSEKARERLLEAEMALELRLTPVEDEIACPVEMPRDPPHIEPPWPLSG